MGGGPPGPERGGGRAGGRAGGRRAERERAFELLYEAEAKSLPPSEVLRGLAITPAPYVTRLVEGVGRRKEEIDALVTAHSIGWPPSRMALIDLLIVRVAVFELLEELELANAVILSEAVGLAKEYSTEGSGRFVNGVLAAVADEVRGSPRSR